MLVHFIKTSSTLLIDVYGEFLLAQLESEEKTIDLASEFSIMQNHLEEMALKRKIAGKKIQRSHARVVKSEWKLSKGLRCLYRDVLNLVDGSRKKELFRKYFPEGLKIFAKRINSKNTMALRKIFFKLEEEENGLKEVHLDTLKELFELWNKAKEKMDESKEDYNKARSHEETSKMAWIQAYDDLRYKLHLIFNDEKSYVSTFFKSKAKKKKEEKKENLHLKSISKDNISTP